MTDVVRFDPTDLVEIDPAEAFAQLWNKFQDEDGKPIDFEANHLLNQIAEGWNAMLANNERLTKQLEAAIYAARSLEFQLGLAVQEASEAYRTADRKARASLASEIANQHNISEEAARLMLDFLTREGDWGINGYAQRVFNDAIEIVGDEIEDFLDADRRPLSEDDYDAS